MLGLYSRTTRPAHELDEFARLRRHVADADPIVLGPVAVAATPESALSQGRVGDLSCVLDGVVYDRPAAANVGAADAVAAAYRRAGVEGLTQLRGRYAALLWDTGREEGVLASDLLATRELFVTRTAAALVFATELRDVLALLATQPGPDEVAFTTWLGDGTCPAGRTLYAGISRLAAGELVVLRAQTAQPRRYWRPGRRAVMRGSRAELADGLRAHLTAAIAKRLSPRASAVILSGGLDSSVVSALAASARAPDATVRTYSAVFPGEDYDETAKIREVNDRLRIAHGAMEIAPQGTLWLALHHAMEWRLPLIAAGSLIDIAATREAASDGAEVILDGQTGDELFGLSPYLLADRIRQGRLLSAVALTDRWPIGRRTSVRNKVWLLKELGLKGAAPHRLGRLIQSRRDHEHAGPPWLVTPLRRAFTAGEDRWAWKQTGSGPMWWRFMSDVLIEAPHRELRLDYLRHRASSAGTVAEPALYDVDLIDYCLSLPPELAFDRRFDRPLVREAMREVLPEDVRVQTRKADFTLFCQRAMVTADAPGLSRLLTDPGALIGAYTNLDWVRSAWAQTASGGGNPRWLGALWRLAAAEVWLRTQADSNYPETELARPDVPPPSVRRVTLSGAPSPSRSSE